jgi:hypothetical protein
MLDPTWQVSTTSSDELRKLFELRPETISDTYDGLGFGDAPCRNQQVTLSSSQITNDSR